MLESGRFGERRRRVWGHGDKGGALFGGLSRRNGVRKTERER